MRDINQVTLTIVEKDRRSMFLDYLLLADESEKVVKEYIYDGEMFSIHYEVQLVGVTLFTFHPNKVVELKNIALDPNYRGKGLGKLVIKEVFELYKIKGFHSMIVGTANSSIGNLSFYQKAGFRMVEIKKDFFEKYPKPIFENGIRAIDMVMFEKQLKQL